MSIGMFMTRPVCGRSGILGTGYVDIFVTKALLRDDESNPYIFSIILYANILMVN